MNTRDRQRFLRPISRRFNNLGSNAIRRSAEALLGTDAGISIAGGNAVDTMYDDDNLAPVMPAIDAVQQLMEQEDRAKQAFEKKAVNKKSNISDGSATDPISSSSNIESNEPSFEDPSTQIKALSINGRPEAIKSIPAQAQAKNLVDGRDSRKSSLTEEHEEEPLIIVRNNPLINLRNKSHIQQQEEYEFIPKSVILDVYSNDPEVKRFLKQLPRIGTEFGYNEQDYKCYSCRRPIGMVFGQSRMCHFDGHHYCSECHLGEKSSLPARILCNWDFNKYPISKRNQHFLTLISNEPMFELKTMAPLLYKTCPELREIEELRCQAFFIRSYCFTCVQDSVSFELTKLVWPREHLIKQTDLYSLEDLTQIKNGTLKNVLKNVITFGRQHVLSCMLCCQKGFICELCKSSQIIYPFDTESVHRCLSCQSIYHKTCFIFKQTCDECPRCQRLKARRVDP